MNLRNTALPLCLTITQLCAIDAFAKETSKPDMFDPGEPAWTLKIPKGRYPCLCDTPPHLWRQQPHDSGPRINTAPEFEMDEYQFQSHIERIIYSKLRFLIEGKFKESGVLTCEVRYQLTRENSITDVEVLAPSKNSDFDSYALKALDSLKSGFVGYPHKQGKKFLVLQSVITPDGVYPGYSGKIYTPIFPARSNTLNELLNK